MENKGAERKMEGFKVEEFSHVADSSIKVEDGQLLEVGDVDDTWDEERLENALKALKEMYIQVPVPLKSLDIGSANPNSSYESYGLQSQGFLNH
jgi:hypothetical protein